jgi:glycosyltransferase involved in cell wall biosynthesis
MRYAYIKYGNVVDELGAIGPSPEHVDQGGPLAFAGGFLRMVGSDPALMMSVVPRRQPQMHLERGSIQARNFAADTTMTSAFAAVAMFLQLLRFRASVIICVRDAWFLWLAYLAAHLTHARFVHSRQRAIRVAGDSWRRRVVALVDVLVLRRADSVVCHGPFAAHQLIVAGVPQTKVVEFDVDFDDLLAEADKASAAPAVARDTGRRRVAFVGRIEASKGVFDLLEACLPLLETYDDVDLLFVGDGAGRGRLQEIVAEKRLSERVVFTGHVPHAQIGVQLRGAVALVTPTRHGLEGWPMSALEGLAIGVPVIAPDAGPFRFMIQRGVNGLLFSVNSVADLRAQLQRLLADPRLQTRLAHGALQSAAQRAQNHKTFALALSEACQSPTAVLSQRT